MQKEVATFFNFCFSPKVFDDVIQVLLLNRFSVNLLLLLGGDETSSGFMRYVGGNQPNVTACTTCRHGVPKLWLWSEQTIGTCTYQTDHRDIY